MVGSKTSLTRSASIARTTRWRERIRREVVSRAKDSAGRQASFYAIAGDHYSLTAPGGRHFCVGCHPGHSGMAPADHHHAERLAP